MSQDIIGFFCTLIEIGRRFKQDDGTPPFDPTDRIQVDPEPFHTPEIPIVEHAATFCQISPDGHAILAEGRTQNYEEEIELVTYGLFQTNLGKRSGSYLPTPHAILEEASRLWEDFQTTSDYAVLHLVKPQFDAPWRITAIVELLSSLHAPPQDRVPILSDLPLRIEMEERERRPLITLMVSRAFAFWSRRRCTPCADRGVPSNVICILNIALHL